GQRRRVDGVHLPVEVAVDELAGTGEVAAVDLPVDHDQYVVEAPGAVRPRRRQRDAGVRGSCERSTQLGAVSVNAVCAIRAGAAVAVSSAARRRPVITGLPFRSSRSRGMGGCWVTTGRRADERAAAPRRGGLRLAWRWAPDAATRWTGNGR